jgi:hypothetical protein
MRTKSTIQNMVQLLPNTATSYLSENQVLRQCYRLYIEQPYNEQSPNVDHDKEVVFIHIDKNAGTSVKSYLDLEPPGGRTSHAFATSLVHPKTWEDYFTFTIVRNPFDRLLSRYFYHTNTDYQGSYFNLFPELHDMTLEEYFYNFKNNGHMSPQICFISHALSDHPIDMVCRFENMPESIYRLSNELGIDREFPKKNPSPREVDDLVCDEDLLEDIIQFFRADFDIFNYSDNPAEIRDAFL